MHDPEEASIALTVVRNWYIILEKIKSTCSNDIGTHRSLKGKFGRV